MENPGHIFIVNPAAGKGFPVSTEKRIKELMEAAKSVYSETEFKIIETKYPGHGTEIARDFSSRGIYRIYSVGGDGTLNEVVNGMAGTESSLGVIPGGTGNDFIKSVAKDYTLPEIIREIILGEPEKIDLGCVNGRYFHNVLSAGFDARVNIEACRLKTKPFVTPKAAYILGITAALKNMKPERFTVTMNGRSEAKDIFMISIANGREYGGGYKIAPGAELNDGLLDVVTVHNVGLLKIMKYIPLLKKGEHLGVPEITSEKTEKLTIESDKPILLNTDGEVQWADKAEITAVPGILNLIYPKNPDLRCPYKIQ